MIVDGACGDSWRERGARADWRDARTSVLIERLLEAIINQTIATVVLVLGLYFPHFTKEVLWDSKRE